MSKRIVIGNWKMNLGGEEGVAYVHTLNERLQEIVGYGESTRSNTSGPEVVVCAPHTLLREMSAITPRSFHVGAQMMSEELNGAYTGQVSVKMLLDAGVQYVLVGHSECRQYLGETDVAVFRKAALALEYGLCPVVCVGESLAQRNAGEALTYVEAQVRRCIEGLQNFCIAYEPLWAIGTGLTPTMTDIAEMHEIIHGVVGPDVPILYGGSVTPENASEIMGAPNVSGVLVGGASLKADSFLEIVRQARELGRTPAEVGGKNVG